MAEKKLSVVITGDARGARKAFGEVGSGAGGMQSKLQSVGAGVGKVFKAAAVGAGVLAVGVGAFLKGGVDSLIELERLGAQTEAVIKSTGGAAGVTADQVSAYADSIEKATGVEAEGIISGQNMLLTFTNLKNGVGEGNDIFNQATDIMTDMSVAMGTDASKTAVQLGKALNDPIKGISALSKVGVTFTEQQKAQIKAMVEAGDVAGAQKVILAELNKEFGGSAEAFGDTTAGKVQKLKNLFGDFQEELASRLLPVITKVADWLAEKIPQASALIQAKLVELGPTFDKIAGYARSIGEALAGLAQKARPVFEAIVGFIQSNPGPAFAALGAVLATAFGVWAVSAGAAAVATLAAAAPVIALVAAVALLAGGLVYAYQHFEGFRTVVDNVATFIRDVAFPAITQGIQRVWETIQTVIGVIKAAWQQWGDELLAIASAAWAFIRTSVENAIRVVQGVIQTVMSAIHGDWSGAWDGIKNILGGVWAQIRNVVSTGADALRAVLSAAWDAMKSAAKSAWEALKRAVSDGINEAVAVVRGFPGKVLAAIGNLASTLYNAGRELISGLVRGITDSIPSVSGVLGRVTDMIPDWKGPASRDAKLLQPNGKLIMGGLVDGIKAGIPALESALDAVSSRIASRQMGVGTGMFTVAAGGAVGGGRAPGRLSLVGERGPELFVPDQAGTIMPAAATRSVLGRSSAGGGNVYVNIHPNAVRGDGDIRQIVDGINRLQRGQTRPVFPAGVAG